MSQIIEQPMALTELAPYYTVEAQHRDEVQAFVQAHSPVLPLLQEAHPSLAKNFPQGAAYLLVERDPDARENCELIVAIDPGCEPDKSYDAYEQFKQDWLLKALDQTHGLILFNIEYR